MKKIRIFATALLLAFTLSSCESFFDVELDDQAKIEDIFRQKTEVRRRHCGTGGFRELYLEIRAPARLRRKLSGIGFGVGGKRDKLGIFLQKPFRQIPRRRRRGGK